MALLLPALQFIGTYSATFSGHIPNRLYVTFGAAIFLAVVATAAYIAQGSGSRVSFAWVAMLYLWCKVADYLLDLVNNRWLPSPRVVPFDILFGISPLLFCWLANRALQHRAEPSVVFRRPWLQSLMPSLVVLAGVALAPFALHQHLILSAVFVTLLVAVYTVRTHLLYRRLMEKQVELRSQAGDLERLATSDALTGIGNRRSLEKAATALLGRTPPSPVALILVDTDHFKHINDAFGHAVGDDVLRLVAHSLCEEIEIISHSSCARLGGDEFVALLPNTDGRTAEELAHHTRRRVQEQSIHQDVFATISVGVSVSNGEWTLTLLLKEADEALYRAKSQGRNRVTVFENGTMLELSSHPERRAAIH